MKRGAIFVFFGLISLLGVLTFVNAVNTDVSSFEVDVFGPSAPVIRIVVPDSIFFGNVSKGKESSRVRVDINNTGNVDVIVMPRLIDQFEEIFNYTYFTRRTTEPYQKIGEFSYNLWAPSDEGGVESDYMYAKVDLRNFGGQIKGDTKGHKTDVKFFAVAA